MPDYKDTVIEDLHRKIKVRDAFIAASEGRCDELAGLISERDKDLLTSRVRYRELEVEVKKWKATVQELDNVAHERWEVIQRLRKEVDFYRGVKMEREEKLTTPFTDDGNLEQEKPTLDYRHKYRFVKANPVEEIIMPGGAKIGAKTELLDTGLTQIPHSAKKEIGKIFSEGEKKYGRDNWKKGVYNKPYQRERAEHAYVHFSEYLDGSSNDGSSPIQQLAKMAWFCVTQIDTLIREREMKDQHVTNDSAQQELQDQTFSQSGPGLSGSLSRE